jgi:hypothetical protein
VDASIVIVSNGDGKVNGEEPFRLVRGQVDRTFIEAMISWSWLEGQ